MTRTINLVATVLFQVACQFFGDALTSDAGGWVCATTDLAGNGKDTRIFVTGNKFCWSSGIPRRSQTPPKLGG
jgi:hypothetical protein